MSSKSKKAPKSKRNFCPDCGAPIKDRRITHEDTCPIYVGIEKVCDEDREYFVKNPGHPCRIREITRAERLETGYLSGAPLGLEFNHVIVTNYPWGRSREIVSI